MKIRENYPLKQHNSFRVDVKTRFFIEYDSVDELHQLACDRLIHRIPVIHIGAGSNMLFERDFKGVVLHSAIRGIDVIDETETDALLCVGAAVEWDTVVDYAVRNGLGGIENLSAIPGETGAAAVQNIGAYGAEIKDVIETVETYNRCNGETQSFARADCRYAYRSSIFKEEYQNDLIVTHVTLRLSKYPVFNIQYHDLHNRLASRPELTLADVRQTVANIRRRKLPSISRLPNAGSFFTNPIIAQPQFEQLRTEYPNIPSWPAANGDVKLSAAWLIERCGLKGKRFGDAGIYPGHALILVNNGQATGRDLFLLARHIILKVRRHFNIILTPEVRIVS